MTKLEEKRKQMKLTQKQLSIILDIPLGTLQNWAEGKRTCTKYLENLILFYLDNYKR